MSANEVIEVLHRLIELAALLIELLAVAVILAAVVVLAFKRGTVRYVYQVQRAGRIREL
jgi:hypothetical protein